MSRRDDLIALRDAVQAGEWFPGLVQRNIGGVQSYHNARKAFEGSVDAALVLFSAVLPDDATAMIGTKKPRAVVQVGDGAFFATAETPARALLLAALNALIAEADT